MARRPPPGPVAPHIDQMRPRNRAGGGGRGIQQESLESILHALRLHPDDPEPDPEEQAKRYSPERVDKVLTGRMTLAELEGIRLEEQYEIADVGRSLLESNRLSEARTVFEGLQAMNPYDHYFPLALGVIAQRSDDPDEAVTHYTRVLRLWPKHPTALAHRGEVLLGMNRVQEGLQDLFGAVEADPEAKEATTERARAILERAKPAILKAMQRAKANKSAVAAPPPRAAPVDGSPKPVARTTPIKKIAPPATKVAGGQTGKPDAAAPKRAPHPGATNAPGGVNKVRRAQRPNLKSPKTPTTAAPKKGK
jgi:tetratricopeptide (TPR) repeat protein